MATPTLSPDPALRINAQCVSEAELRPAALVERDLRPLIHATSPSAEVWNEYGVALYRLNDLLGAIASYKQALRLAPEWVAPYANLGNAYLYLGKIEESLTYYRQALKLNPNMAGLHCNLGTALKQIGLHVEAEAAFTKSLALDPNQTVAHFNLASLWESHENFTGAAKHYCECLRLQPNRILRELRRITMCPTVFGSSDAIDVYRQRLLDEVLSFGPKLKTVDQNELELDGCAPPFNLPYHGRDDRPIKEAFSAIYRGKIRDTLRSQSTRGEGPGRIGFVVTHRHEFAMLRCLGGILDNLPEDVGHLIVFCDTRSADTLQFGLNLNRVQVVPVPRQLLDYAEAIQAANLDVLYHWEVGTDSTNYLLPFLGLAPVQCTSWGIPETSGIRELTYLSSNKLEVADAQRDYSERLICLPTLLAFYRHRTLAGNRPILADFGLPSNRHIYLCPQYAGKLHPEFDPILADILRQDESGVIALVTNATLAVKEKLQERLFSVMPDVAERILFLPSQRDASYLHLMSLAHVVLDPLHYGGVTTTYDAFAIGTPVVTLPTRFQRGRYATALYREMSLDIGIATDPNDYAHRALSLAANDDLRESVRESILERNCAIFENFNTVNAFADCFRQLIAEARTSCRFESC